jgi:hypothetical protein
MLASIQMISTDITGCGSPISNLNLLGCDIQGHMREDQVARITTAKMHRMFALVHRLGVRGRELWPQGIRSRNVQADRFTLFVLQTHEPYPDLHFDDLTPGYELNSIVRVERVVGVDRSGRLDMAVRGA